MSSLWISRLPNCAAIIRIKPATTTHVIIVNTRICKRDYRCTAVLSTADPNELQFRNLSRKRFSRISGTGRGYEEVINQGLQPSREELKKAYEGALAYCRCKKLPDDVDPEAVFACKRLDLRDIDVYGFDYDYTIACYRPELEKLIYNLGREVLIDVYKYPKEIERIEYNPTFAIRGLHYDIQKGLLLKVDSFMQIQLGCVYRGLTKLSDDEVLTLYGSRKLPMKYVENQGKSAHESPNMVQLADLFSVPEMDLLCNLTEYLCQNNIDYCPESLFRDVQESVRSIHPRMHRIVAKMPQKYLHFDPLLRRYLQLLRDSDKKLFLITNSPYQFVNNGMRFLVGEDWRGFFDVIVVGARKPHFFSNKTTPFRLYDADLDARLWDRVTTFEKDKVYYEGTLNQFQDITGWTERVLYFGDHPYSDLADITLHHGWRTGAIIKELADEIDILNDPHYKFATNWLSFLTSLLESYQDLDDSSCDDIIQEWHLERDCIRDSTKAATNPQFGSRFRTHLNPSYFSKRIFRFSDIYMPSLTNLLNYSVRHTFYPRRGALPHEYRSWFN